jgi:AraC-like DNA-binding protein
MLLLQSALCFGGNALTVLIIILLTRDARRFLAARIAIALFIGTTAYSLTLLPEGLALPRPLFRLAVLLTVPTLGLNWLFGRVLLEDGFRLRTLEWSVLAATSLLALAAAAPAFGVTLPGQTTIWDAGLVVSWAVMAHILWIAISGFPDDLVDVRRVIRVWFVIFVLFTYVAVMAIDLSGLPPAATALAYDGATIAIGLSILLWATHLNTEKLFAPVQPAPAANVAVPARQTHAYRRLMEVMEQERAYRDHGLSIRSLAERVGLPEHQLRRLINDTLGHRNFAAFLNGYRIAEAREALSDPEKTNTPILTIAMDSGYSTLSTFNRAFKAQEGETPSAFRRRMWETTL